MFPGGMRRNTLLTRWMVVPYCSSQGRKCWWANHGQTSTPGLPLLPHWKLLPLVFSVHLIAMPSSVSSHASSAQGSGRMGHRLSIDRHESIQADLQVLEDQVRAWLQRILQQDFTAFWDDLRTGVPLCKVLTTLGHEVKYIGNAQAHTFKAADNIAQFLIVCQRHSLVPSYALFDTEDLIDHKNPRQVLLCLLRLAKIAIAQGVAPPKILKEELGIQELQSQSSLTEADIQKFIEDEDKARKV